jgi:ketosteroid isomerase-like protein
MSRENVEIVRSIYEGVQSPRLGCGVSRPEPGCRIDNPPEGTQRGDVSGREECQRFWEDLLGAFEAASAEPEELFERGDQVAVILKARARPKGTSAELELRNGALWTIRDGMVVSVRLFAKPEEALEAAGLEE